MKNRLSYFLPALIGAMLLCSCFKDKGNYDYSELTEIDLEIEEEMTVQFGSQWTYRPEVTFTGYSGNDEDYVFTWMRIYGEGTTSSRSTKFLDGRNIEDLTMMLPKGTHWLFLKVQDKNTGITWQSGAMKLTVVSEIGAGLVVMGEEAGGTRLDFINYSPIQKKFVPIRISTDGLPELGAPIQVATHRDINAPYFGSTVADGRYSVTVLTETGGYRLNPENFSYYGRETNGTDPDFNIAKDQSIQAVIYGTDEPMKVSRFYTTVGKNENQAMIRNADGDHFVYNMVGITLYWNASSAVNYTQSVDRINVSEKAIFLGLDARSRVASVLFCPDNHTFYYEPMVGSQISLYCLPYADQDETDPNLADFKLVNGGRDLVHLFGRLESGQIAYAYALTTDGTRYFFSKFRITDGSKVFHQDITSSEDIANGEMFTMTSNDTNNQLLYYTNGRRVFAYNTTDRVSPVVYTAEGSRRISYLGKMHIPDTNNPWADNIVVATYDPAAPDTSGKLEVLRIASPDGTLEQAVNAEDNNAPLVWDGLAKVVSVDWKNQ